MDDAAGGTGQGEVPLGVSLDFLLEWVSSAGSLGTAWDVSESIKKRLESQTTTDCTTYLELVGVTNRVHVGRANLFLSHCWTNQFEVTIRTATSALQAAKPDLKKENIFVWMDVLCLNQNATDLMEDDEELAMGYVESVKETIELVGRTICVLPDWSTTEPVTTFSRAWCIWELACTPPGRVTFALSYRDYREVLQDLNQDILSIMNCVQEEHFQSNLSESSLESCTNMLHQAFQEFDEGGFEQIDNVVRQHFYTWLMEVVWGEATKLQVEAELSKGPARPNQATPRRSLRNSLRTQAMLISSATSAFLEVGAIPQALQLFKGIFQLHERNQGIEEYARISAIHYVNLADLLSQVHKYEEAVKYYTAALELNRKYEPQLLTDTLCGLAENLANLGRNKEAEAYFEEVVRLDELAYQQDKSCENRKALQTSLLNMGSHLESTDLARALTYLEKASEHAVELYKEDEADNTVVELRRLAELYVVAEDFVSASRTIEKFLTVQGFCSRQTGLKSGQDEKIAPLSVHYDVDQLTPDEVMSLGDDLAVLGKCIVKESLNSDSQANEHAFQALDDAVTCLDGALDLHIRSYGPVHELVKFDYQMLVVIENQRGNSQRAAELTSNATQVEQDLLKVKYRSGPMVELVAKFSEMHERMLPQMLQEVKQRQNFEEVAGVLELLSDGYHRKQDVEKQVALLCEATKLKLFAVEKLKTCSDSKLYEFKLRALRQEIDKNLLSLHELFLQVDGGHFITQQSSNYVKIVQIHSKSATSSTGKRLVIQALAVHARLLTEAGEPVIAARVYNEAFAFGKVEVDENGPSEVWLELLENASTLFLSMSEFKQCILLQEQILAAHDRLQGSQDEQSAQNMSRLAATKTIYANKLKSDLFSAAKAAKYFEEAEALLHQSIALVQKLQQEQDTASASSPPNSSLSSSLLQLYRQLAALHMEQGALEPAALNLRRALEICPAEEPQRDDDAIKLEQLEEALKAQRAEEAQDGLASSLQSSPSMAQTHKLEESRGSASAGGGAEAEGNADVDAKERGQTRTLPPRRPLHRLESTLTGEAKRGALKPSCSEVRSPESATDDPASPRVSAEDGKNKQDQAFTGSFCKEVGGENEEPSNSTIKRGDDGGEQKAKQRQLAKGCCTIC
mmetsp:Transcript_10852/g.19173  ORF Transcript_10852/g.19173 Transcript_10852/m.19173 type:complete len:1141 (+) Transcript_10852:173-3595(+)